MGIGESAAALGAAGEKALRERGYFVRIAERSRVKRAPGLRVLVVEDNEATALTLVTVLGKSGYAASVARNIEEITTGLAARPHIVLLDVMLPDTNGFEVLEAIRQAPELAGTRVLMVTSLSEPKDIARGMALGADGYLIKPALPSMLLEAVALLVAD